MSKSKLELLKESIADYLKQGADPEMIADILIEMGGMDRKKTLDFIYKIRDNIKSK